MTWVDAPGGRLVDKAEWTSAAKIEAFVVRYRQGRSRKPASGTMSPYRSEHLEHRDVDRDAFCDRLRRIGPRAYTESKRAELLWQQLA